MSFIRSLVANLRSQVHCMPRRQAVVCFSSKSRRGPKWLTQIDDFRRDSFRSWDRRQRIRAVCSKIQLSEFSLMRSRSPIDSQLPDILKCNELINSLSELYKNLGEILKESPDEYYRYHNEWSSDTRLVVSSVAFCHWIETGRLLLHSEAMKKLGSEFELDIEDYLHGLCIMTSYLPGYYMVQILNSNHVCPKKALALMRSIHYAFGQISHLNDDLRTQYEGKAEKCLQEGLPNITCVCWESEMADVVATLEVKRLLWNDR